ncbi:MAG TPA: hypothetical protein PKA27_16525 [Fimbriimonadaceae bacterium]|nr:hypothetical protein [Fimbriimonadaceae bacterium]
MHQVSKGLNEKGRPGRLTGNPGRSGWWNNKWAQFFKESPSASKKQIEEFLQKLLDEAKIGDIPIGSGK